MIDQINLGMLSFNQYSNILNPDQVLLNTVGRRVGHPHKMSSRWPEWLRTRLAPRLSGRTRRKCGEKENIFVVDKVSQKRGGWLPMKDGRLVEITLVIFRKGSERAEEFT